MNSIPCDIFQSQVTAPHSSIVLERSGSSSHLKMSKMRWKKEGVFDTLSDFKETSIILSKGRNETRYASYSDAIGESGVEKFGSPVPDLHLLGCLFLEAVSYKRRYNPPPLPRHSSWTEPSHLLCWQGLASADLTNNGDGAAMSFLVGRHGVRLLNRQYLGLLNVSGAALVKTLHL